MTSAPIAAKVYCPYCHQPNIVTPRQGCDVECEHWGKDYVIDVRAETLEKYLGVEHFDGKKSRMERTDAL